MYEEFGAWLAVGAEKYALGADEIGVLRLTQEPHKRLAAGDVGYIISGIKTSKEVKVGDTITHVLNPCKEAIDGFEEVNELSRFNNQRAAAIIVRVRNNPDVSNMIVVIKILSKLDRTKDSRN